ncbi:Dihydropteroate synthase [Psychromonas ingrahamii 37]|uniref:Dihydropteroate synthase n=1 Tax=Psychromonas ingrahamii (strain DSM 17664 / CCUG 51855 / 37) TaxID=357804 RepID=A1ST40_PSYIN|nr:dihydropteroate synthase [Psychromonas ingrahamii]ABM02655.1 Dihydropteroate synthase [Psychromonas ingrahamii 37]
MQLISGSKILDLSEPKVMGILNVTPDSFSDGGRFSNIDNALKQAQKMLEQGASILDIGGESTRPGAIDVSEQQELDRVIPVIEQINQEFDCWISIDTSKANVMQAAVNAGADLINDVRALREDNALDVAVNANVPVCLMHMQGQPRSMQSAPEYENVIEEVKTFLLQRAEICINAGIKKENIILDLGFGFGKQLNDNYELLAATDQFVKLNYPILTGLSRKSMFGQLLNRDVTHRLAGSLAGALIALQQGSQIIRVHDVAETADVIKVLQTVNAFKK